MSADAIFSHSRIADATFSWFEECLERGKIITIPVDPALGLKNRDAILLLFLV